jgi:hypothetical protein
VDHLPAVEALFVLPCCCCSTTPVVPPAITGLSRKFFSFNDTFYNNHINSQYVFLSIIPFFIFGLLLFKFRTVIVSNSYTFKLLLFWTVTVTLWTVTLSNCYSFEPLLSAEVAFRPPLIFLTLFRVWGLHFKWGWLHWKAKTWGCESSKEGEPSSAIKIVKIAHRQIRLTAL